MVLQKALCIIIGYVFGLFQTGFIIGKMHNIDIRDYGSGNSGTTNTMRTLGKKYGFITYFGDALKAVFAIILTSFMFGKVCSDSMMAGFFIEMIVWGQLGMVHNLHSNDKIEAYILVFIMTALSFIRHKENIKRLLNGTERKIGHKKEESNG